MTQTRINERIQIREQLMEQNRVALEEHVLNNENLTDEQIGAILNAIQERSRTQSERWEAQKQAWQDRMNNQNQPPYDQENDDTDTEENPS